MIASLALAAALVAAPATVTLHPNAQTTLSIGGARGALTASGAQTLVSVTPDAQPGVLDLTAGAQTGTGTLHVSDAAGNTIDVSVRVARDAGTFPSRMHMVITGSPVAWSWLWSRVSAAIARAAAIAGGATLTAASPPPQLPPAPGERLDLDVPVRITGAGLYDAFGTTRVTIDNASVQPVAPPLLFYDDDPERLDANGVLFRAAVSRADAARLYYYHQDLDAPRRVVLVLHALHPGVVQVIDANAGPNVDVLSVGHAVTRDMLDVLPRDEGEVFSLDPSRPLVLRDIPIDPKEVVAGTLDLAVLRGGPVELSVLALAPGEDPFAVMGGKLLPRDGHHREGIFVIRNFGTQSLSYTAGGPDAAIEYGSRDAAPANLDAAARGTDYGDYGVVHTLLFSLANPAASSATVYLYERPAGGIVRSSFLVDGVLHQVGCVRDSHERYAIAAFSLAPQSRYQLNVDTMTDGGSNYPIEVGLTATPPEPHAPPISAPDGCFPKP